MKKIVLILLLALLLRLPLLGGSFWLDEAAQALESARPFSRQLLIRDDFQPPLLHYLVHFMLAVSHDEAWLRLVSVASGLITIGLLYLILKHTTGEKTALVASFLLAINPFHLFFSQELRPYALAAMFASLSWYALIKEPKSKMQNLIFVMATVGGLYSMYLYPFVLLSQLVFVFFEKKPYVKTFILHSLISVLLFLPWLPSFIGQLQAGTALTGTLPGWSSVVATPQLKALPMVVAKFIVGQVELKDSVVFYLLTGMVGLIFLISSIPVWKEKKNRYLIYWFYVTVVGSWLISFVVPVIQPKRVMVALPAFVGIMGLALAQGKKIKILSFKSIALFFTALVFLSCDLLYWTTPKYQREDWRGVISQIEADAEGRHAAALFAFPEPFAPWRWYSNGEVTPLVTGSLRVTDPKKLEESLSSVQQFNPVFYFEYLSDLSDPQHLIQPWLVQRGFRKVSDIDGRALGFVRIYENPTKSVE